MDEFVPNKCKHCEESLEGKSRFYSSLSLGYYCSNQCLHAGSTNRENERKQALLEINHKKLTNIIQNPKKNHGERITSLPLTGEPINQAIHPWKQGNN